MTLIFIGTQGDTPTQGIHAARLDEADGILIPLGLMAVVERPTCLITDPARPLLYAVSEVGNAGDRIGEVVNFTVHRSTGTLSPLSRTPSGGGGPTHLALAAHGKTLFVANFAAGQATVIPIAAGDMLGPASSTRTGTGSGPHRRQKGPHAHGVTLDPSERFLLVPDMGADRIFVYPYHPGDATLADRSDLHVEVPAGAGPRLVLFGKDGRFAYLLTELSAHILVFAWDGMEGRLTPRGSLSLDAPDGFDTPPDNASAASFASAAGFAMSPDGRFLYASNRRTHAIHVFAIDREDGDLAPVQVIPAGGEKPWAIAVTPSGRWLLAANQGSDLVSLFGVDTATGRLTAMPATIQVPCPTGLAFMQDHA